MKPSLSILSPILLSLVACGDPDASPTDTTGGEGGSNGAGMSGVGLGGASQGDAGETSSGGMAGAQASAPACNELELDAPAVGFSYDDGPAPAASGGEITDGTYFVTAQVVYETASGPTLALGRTKVVLVGATWQEVSGDPEAGSVNPDRHTTSTLSVTDPFLDLERTCPSEGAPESAEYSVGDGAFTIYFTDAGKTVGTVFTKQ